MEVAKAKGGLNDSECTEVPAVSIHLPKWGHVVFGGGVAIVGVYVSAGPSTLGLLLGIIFVLVIHAGLLAIGNANAVVSSAASQNEASDHETYSTGCFKELYATVLSDFRSLDVAPLRDQAACTQILQRSLQQAQVSMVGAEGEEAVNIEDKVEADMERYAIRAPIIGARQWVNFTAEGDALRTHPDPSMAPTGLNLAERMGIYKESACRIVEQAWPEEEGGPADIIHVSCSGYEAPNPVERVLAGRGNTSTQVTNCYHMGCYAAFPAVRMATGFVASGGTVGRRSGRVDVLHTELLSLHADLTDVTPGNLITMSLFGDGAIRYSASASSDWAWGEQRGMLVEALNEIVIPGTAEDMTWKLTPHQFNMYLSRRVPQVVSTHVSDFVDGMCASVGMRGEDARRDAIFAVHPGGPSIVTGCQKALGLEDAQVRWSREILAKRGNMSSATVPHIWKAILDDDSVPVGTKIVSLGFGPGLTATGAVLRKV